VQLVDDLGLGKGDLAGSYCILNGTQYDKTRPPSVACDAAQKNCGSDGSNP